MTFALSHSRRLSTVDGGMPAACSAFRHVPNWEHPAEYSDLAGPVKARQFRGSPIRSRWRIARITDSRFGNGEVAMHFLPFGIGDGLLEGSQNVRMGFTEIGRDALIGCQ